MTKQAKPGFFSAENMRFLLIMIPVIFMIRWSIAAPYHVPTASMEPTIKVDDRLFVWKLAYEFKIPFTDYSLFQWSDVERGDIIVFKYPKDPDLDYVKRVVGLPGDQLQIIDDVLYVNGEKQNRVSWENDRSILEDIKDNPEFKELYRETVGDVEHWVLQNSPSERRFMPKNWPAGGGTVTVPEDSLFVLGDNRDNSTDSRIWGRVPRENVRGKALFVLWSMWFPNSGLVPDVRWDRFGQGLDKGPEK